MNEVLSSIMIGGVRGNHAFHPKDETTGVRVLFSTAKVLPDHYILFM